jgi:enamine deaminase RidA (YjgF/YER057c/UK114 family)
MLQRNCGANFQVFAEKGLHSRSAVGVNALPLNVAVEIEAIFEIEE